MLKGVLISLHVKNTRLGEDVSCVCCAQSCATLCDPMDSSPPGSSAHVILQARILKWVTIPFPRDLPNSGIKPGSSTWQAEFSPSEPPGKPNVQLGTNKIFHFLDYFFH